MNVKRVIFIRPGETEWNRQGRWQGWVAVPLNALGRRQAMALAKHMRSIGIAALYSSDIQRAVDTASILSTQLGFSPVYDQRLRERAIGQWQGLTIDEIMTWYRDEYAALLADPEHHKITGGESVSEVCDRMLAAFTEIIADSPGDTVGMVTHTTAIRALLGHLIPDARAQELEFSNSSVTTIMREGDSWKVIAPNDTLHLEGMESHSVPELEDRA